MRQKWGQGMAQGIMRRLDKNDDGRLDKSEMPGERLGKFADADSSGDGFVDQRELIAAMMAMRGRMQDRQQGGSPERGDNLAGRVTRNMMEMDANKDGRLNADEAAPRLKSRFSDVDRNGDGYLDSGEVMRRVKQRLREMRKDERPRTTDSEFKPGGESA